VANTYSDLIPKILAGGISYLQANCILPRLVNRDYDGPAATKGSIINVPIPPTITTTAVSAAASQPSNSDTTFSTVAVNLDHHYEAVFFLTDKERKEIMDGAESMAARSAMASLCDYIDTTIFTAMDVGGSIATGTAGTTPFATLALALDPLTYLSTHKMPSSDRRVVMNARANANLLGLTGFTSKDFIQGEALRSGNFSNMEINGASWWMDQNAPTHTAGTGASYLVNNGSGLAVGATTVAADTGSGTILAGDVVTFAGDSTNKYVVATALSGGSFTIGQPGLKVAIADNAAITVSASHTANFAFAREAIVFASRPFERSGAVVAMDQMTDPISGLTLRLEITRQNKQDKWSFDALWGTKVVRPHGVIKVMG
jgi:hypothetical protein